MQPKSYKGRFIHMDSRFVFGKIFLFVAMPIGIVSLLALNMHVTFTDQEFRQCGFAFKPCTSYSYSSIKRISTIDGR